MRTLFVLLLSLSINSTVWADTQPTYDCTDGDTKVLVYLDGDVQEEGDVNEDIFKNNHRIVIVEGVIKAEYKRFIAATWDGGGQESFQAYMPGRLSPLNKVVDFYFEHESAYLVGGFQSIVEDGWIRFKGEAMKCNEDF